MRGLGCFSLLDSLCRALSVVVDADRQDPPELIPNMLQAWGAGADEVNMRRIERDGETVSKKAVTYLILPESNRFMKDLFSWIGFNQVTLDYLRKARAFGESKWPYWLLWNFALEGITSFSTVPLRMATSVGAVLWGCFLRPYFFNQNPDLGRVS